MKNLIILLGFSLILILNSCSHKSEITTGTLLSEMINRDVLPEFPYPAYTTKQFSSYDRKSVSPNKEGWFANADRSQFLRIESNGEKREFVMLDTDGPGAIVRFWITVAGYEGNGTLRIYIDGKEKPELEGEVLNLLSGGGIVEPPLAASVSELNDYSRRGHNLYLPIPYSKHCKITYESNGVSEKPGAESGEAFYYNINYRTYTDAVSMRSFSKNDLVKYATEISVVQQQLVENKLSTENEVHEKSKTTLQAEQSIDLQLKGSKAIRKLSIQLDAENYEQALRSTVLEIQFDGEQTVWCPVGDFLGTGYKLSPYKTFYTEVTVDGILSCQWIMPFLESAEVTIRNYGDQEVKINKFEVETSDYNWTNNTMHFGAGWFEQNHLESMRDGKNELGEEHGHFDVNYVTLSGKGVLVGNGVTLFNTIDAWWGEGDEKIFVDNELFPSHFGTGTEDFYGYAWSRPEKFDHPFIAQPDGAGAQKSGHVVNQRYRALDVIPFNKKIQVDVEMWHWLKTTINHAPISYWYVLPGGKSNIEPDPKAVRNPVALSRLDFYLEGFFENNIFMKGTEVNIKSGKDYEIRYTTDGTDPGPNSKLYTQPFKINKTTTIKAIGYTADGNSTKILEGDFVNQKPKKSTKLRAPKPGLKYDYFKVDEVLEASKQLDKFEKTSSGKVAAMEFPKIELSELFGIKMRGYVKVPKAGIYTFSTNSNDGSMLYVHNELIVNNDGGHGNRERYGQISLTAGYHPIELVYFQMGGGKHLEVSMEGPGIEKHQITDKEFYYKNQILP